MKRALKSSDTLFMSNLVIGPLIIANQPLSLPGNAKIKKLFVNTELTSYSCDAPKHSAIERLMANNSFIDLKFS